MHASLRSVSFSILSATLLFGQFSNAASCIQTPSEIAAQLQRAGTEISQCKIKQVLAAEMKHVQMTGGSCEAASKTHLVSLTDATLVVDPTKGPAFESKVTVVTEGLGEAADTFIVSGLVTPGSRGNDIDCQITSTRLAPLDDGLPSPVAQPYPYKQHPRQ